MNYELCNFFQNEGRLCMHIRHPAMTSIVSTYSALLDPQCRAKSHVSPCLELSP